MEPSASPDAARLERELLDLIGEHFADGRVDLHADLRLVDAGIDSMATIQLLVLIEKRFGFWLPEIDVSAENLETVRTLGLALGRRMAESARPT